MMHITTRNFFRLIRAGTFGQQEPVEPMSMYKWRQTMLFSQVHHVEAEAYAGLEVLSDQFFVQVISDSLREEWAEMASASRPSTGLRLNSRLEKMLSRVADEEHRNTHEYRVLEDMTLLAYAMLTDNQWIRQLLVLGETVRERGSKADRERLKQWIAKMHLQKMSYLEGALLIQLMGLTREELPFDPGKSDFNVTRFASAIPHSQEQMSFSQGKDIFVHTGNKSAVLWNARRSARFFPYYPLESIANFFSSFASSLNNIEE